MRKKLSKKARFDVFKRDSFTCQYCGATPPQVILHVDHINPVANGGKNDVDNLITACEACNQGKGARLLSDAPKSLLDRANEIAEREEQLAGYNAVLVARATRIENQAWDIAAVLECKDFVETYDRRNLISIKRFLERLPAAQVFEAAEIAAAMKTPGSAVGFRYFCGICWAKIKRGDVA